MKHVTSSRTFNSSTEGQLLPLYAFSNRLFNKLNVTYLLSKLLLTAEAKSISSHVLTHIGI